jgi:hypothetical protein
LAKKNVILGAEHRNLKPVIISEEFFSRPYITTNPGKLNCTSGFVVKKYTGTAI